MTNEQLTEAKQVKPQPTKVEQEEAPSKRVKLRLLPIWLRVILVVLLLIIAAVIGLVIGYSVIGEGNGADVLKADTWQHILDIMNGVEK